MTIGSVGHYNMRLVIDILIVALLAALMGVTQSHRQTRKHRVDNTHHVHRAMVRLHEQAVYHGALAQLPVSEAGFPTQVSPLWFGERGVPMNVMVPGRQRWLDIAPPGDFSDHPPDPVITRPDQAGFWYNPNLGIIRARVAAEVVNGETLRQYNHLNRCALEALPIDDHPSRAAAPPQVLVMARQSRR